MWLHGIFQGQPLEQDGGQFQRGNRNSVVLQAGLDGWWPFKKPDKREKRLGFGEPDTSSAPFAGVAGAGVRWESWDEFVDTGWATEEGVDQNFPITEGGNDFRWYGDPDFVLWHPPVVVFVKVAKKGLAGDDCIGEPVEFALQFLEGFGTCSGVLDKVIKLVGELVKFVG